MKLPVFSLQDGNNNSITNDDLSSGIAVLYLYPRDNTPGCTLEAKDFRDEYDRFKELGVEVYGLSKDSVASHEKFCTKYELPFPLISDPNAELIEALGGWKEKSMYGKTFMGIERSTFVIKDGEIVKEWRKVKVKNHVNEVLDFIKTLV
jgi:peroxiredoxin Q/BCP